MEKEGALMVVFKKVSSKFFKWKVPVWTVLFIGIVIIVVSLIQPFTTSQADSQSVSMVKYLKEVNEHVFLNVGVESVETKTENTKIPWTKIGIPLTEKKALIILNYDAKLGIKQPVTIKEVNEKKIRIEIPKYEVIGFELDEKNPYSLYDSSGDLLSYSTKNIDTGEIVTETLSTEKQEHYLDQYQEQLNNSAKEYYESLFKPLDEEIELEIIYPEQ